MEELHHGILSVLAYFDLFSYPLAKEEVSAFLPAGCGECDVENGLQQLAGSKIIYRLDEFYSLQQDLSLAERRRKGNRLALRQLKIAGKVATLLSRFPYVRGVAISGSLSKNYAEPAGDIDFFIITSANRLWIARTLMHLFKKLTFLAGKEDWFCMNYYVDESALKIEVHNIYTAMETVTLLPLRGLTVFKRFAAENSWAAGYFPRCSFRLSSVKEIPAGIAKRQAEKMGDHRTGDRLDDWLMRVTCKRWQRKAEQGRRNAHGIRMGMKAGKHFSMPDPGYFQEEVLRLYSQKLQEAGARLRAASTKQGTLLQGI